MIEIKLIAKPIELFQKLEDHAPQHLFILKIDNYGDKYVIRGGSKGGDGFINWLTADLEVTVSKYIVVHPDYPAKRKRFDNNYEECKGFDKLPSYSLAVGDGSEISQYWEKAVSRAEWINQQRFDYCSAVRYNSKYNFKRGNYAF